MQLETNKYCKGITENVMNLMDHLSNVEKSSLPVDTFRLTFIILNLAEI